MAIDLGNSVKAFRLGEITRGRLITIIRKEAEASSEIAAQYLTHIQTLRRNDAIDGETVVALERAVKTVIVRHDAKTRAAHGLTAPAPRGQIAIGTVLRDRFIIDDVLGVGGMGTVYKGRDTLKLQAQDPNPFVAIKMMNEDTKAQGDSFIALQREAARQQKLAHPNIATVYDFDEASDDFFITMEFLQGVPLNEYLDQDNRRTRGLTTDEAKRTIRSLADALEFAHQHGFIHSDFKPEKCFVTDDGNVKVLDFGISRAIRASSWDSHTVADDFTVPALTPAFASAEMLENSDRADPSDDVYALACVAYEILAGNHPFARMPATIVEQQGLTPEPLAKLSRAENQAIAHALAFRHADRTPSVAQFLSEFEGSPPEKRWLRIAASAAIAALGLVVAVFAIDWYTSARVNSLVADIVSTDDSLIEAALAKVPTLNEDARQEVLLAAQDPLTTYFATEIDARVIAQDFDNAAALIGRARDLYRDSARIEIAAAAADTEKNRLLGELGDVFEQRLRERRLIDVDGRDGDLPEVIARIQAIAPNDPIISGVRLENTYAAYVEDLVAERELRLAWQVLTTGQTLVPDSIVLRNAADRLDAATEERVRAAAIDTLAERLSGQLNNLASLPGIEEIKADLEALAASDPTHPALEETRRAVAPIVKEWLSSSEPPPDLQEVSRLERELGPVLITLGLEEERRRLQELYTLPSASIEKLSSELTALLETGTYDQETTLAAQQLLTRFETVTPNDRQAEAFRRQFADAYLRRVRDERASGNWNNARALLNAASSLFPSAESASAIEAERARIASDEEAVQQRVTATDTTTRVAQLQQQIASAMATAASIADARRIRSMAASLAKLDPDNPQLTGVDVLLQQKLISAAFARAERSGSWHASLVLIEQATELFAAATIVAEAHAVIEERYQRELATARSARLAETTASIDDLLAGAPTPPDWRFSEQLVNALADLTSLLPEGSSLRDDYVAKAAAV